MIMNWGIQKLCAIHTEQASCGTVYNTGLFYELDLSHVQLENLTPGMRFPTMWYVQPAKPQISLGICTVWSEPLQVAWIFYAYMI